MTATAAKKENDFKKRQRKRKKGADLNQGLRLDAPKRNGFVRRWVTNNTARMNQIDQNDYEPVLDDNGEVMRRFSGTDENGNAEELILVETPQEWFDDAQVDKQASVVDPADLPESQVADGEYTPKGKASAISTEKLR